MANPTDDSVLEAAMRVPLETAGVHGARSVATRVAPAVLPLVKTVGRASTVGSVLSLLESRPVGAATMEEADWAKLRQDRQQADWLEQQPGHEPLGAPPASFQQQTRSQLTGAPPSRPPPTPDKT